MRQAGLLAAAGLYALAHNFERLAEDHRRAKALAAAAARGPGLAAEVPETNIVMIDLVDPALSAAGVLEALAGRGVWMTDFGPRRLRAVTHLDIDDAGIERAAQALVEAATTALAA
jgi:threonine aldolase